MKRYIDAEDVEKRIDIVMGSEPKAWDKKALKELKMYVVHAVPTADVVEVGKWCDMHEYIIEMQADENGHNEFFRIIKLPVIFSDDELKMKEVNHEITSKSKRT